MLSEKFVKKIVDNNPAKAFFMCQQWTSSLNIILKVPTTDSFVLFLKRISGKALLTQTSVITCK